MIQSGSRSGSITAPAIQTMPDSTDPMPKRQYFWPIWGRRGRGPASAPWPHRPRQKPGPLVYRTVDRDGHHQRAGHERQHQDTARQLVGIDPGRGSGGGVPGPPDTGKSRRRFEGAEPALMLQQVMRELKDGEDVHEVEDRLDRGDFQVRPTSAVSPASGRGERIQQRRHRSSSLVTGVIHPATPPNCPKVSMRFLLRQSAWSRGLLSEGGVAAGRARCVSPRGNLAFWLPAGVLVRASRLGDRSQA